jgi:septum site-determining protein MinD
MLTTEDVLEILSIPLLGIIPESPTVLKASNTGTPVILDDVSIAGKAYSDAVSRLMGEQTEIRMFQERRGLFQRFLRRTA